MFDDRTESFVQVAVLYYMGMMGHFSLGNSNTLATIDVAGAFIVCPRPFFQKNLFLMKYDFLEAKLIKEKKKEDLHRMI